MDIRKHPRHRHRVAIEAAHPTLVSYVAIRDDTSAREVPPNTFIHAKYQAGRTSVSVPIPMPT